MPEHTEHTHGATSGKKLWLSLAVTLLFCGGEAANLYCEMESHTHNHDECEHSHVHEHGH